MSLDNKISLGWNKFFTLKSPRFLIEPFFQCYRAGYEDAIQDEWTISKPRQLEVVKLKLTEALRQRDTYAGLINVGKDYKEHFEKLLNDIK